ncbi:phenylacetate--CoA ligase family protein [Desulfotalea psychrophila]|uniref:Related to coenzyme F390 synthetase n=1 Tax=Desulfotalea psychrophila (strain LSv54 / DSM 12343) TaxID=177439 RepID=Q6AM40_DESPS|nr:AMP-binding protein [Desulfotalea psychrophila]CAG36585.1 related to coenzyme F390 synthetase [Desulfotalea psychrophila LSv54]
MLADKYNIEQAISLRRAPLAQIEEVQLVLLKRHLLHALSIPFYKKALGIGKKEIEALSSVAELSQLPFTTREQLDSHADAFGLRNERAFRDIALTSGTTGNAVVVPYTEADLKRLAFNEAMAFYGAGVRPEDRVLLTVTLDRCFVAGLAYYSGITFLGASAIRSGPGQPARQWHTINTLKPKIIVGVPTFLRDLGQWALAEGIDPATSSIKSIITIGESVRQPDHGLTPLGAQLHDLWQADLYSSYGATEFETAFSECTMARGGHVHPELMLVEVVDDHGRVVADGVSGEVVVTPLGIEGFPLVRLKTGDISRLENSPCACGWNTKRLGPVEGRLAQRLKYKGTTLYPETIFNILQKVEAVSGAYVEVRTGADGIDDVHVVVGCDDKALDKKFEEMLQAQLRVKPTLTVLPPEQVKATMTADGGRKPRKFFDYR